MRTKEIIVNGYKFTVEPTLSYVGAIAYISAVA